MKTVLITGASGGIGAATARAFARKGYRVIIHYNKGKESAEALSASLPSSFTVQADLSNGDAVRRMLDEAGHIDVLVNNAAVADFALSDTISDAQWRYVHAVNLDGAFYCSREAMKGMLEQKSGSIVFVSSVWGIHGGACEAAYSSSKAALIGLTKSLAAELGPSGIRVNCVAPGVIDTAMNARLSDEEKDALCQSTPLCRMGTPEEVADAVLFMAEASFVTGAVLSVDGGFCL